MKTYRRARIWAAVAVALMLSALVGCSSVSGGGGSPAWDEDAGDVTSSLYERTIELTDGRTVTCVIYAASRAGGVSCDWDGASE